MSKHPSRQDSNGSVANRRGKGKGYQSRGVIFAPGVAPTPSAASYAHLPPPEADSTIGGHYRLRREVLPMSNDTPEGSAPNRDSTNLMINRKRKHSSSAPSRDHSPPPLQQQQQQQVSWNVAPPQPLPKIAQNQQQQHEPISYGMPPVPSYMSRMTRMMTPIMPGPVAIQMSDPRSHLQYQQQHHHWSHLQHMHEEEQQQQQQPHQIVVSHTNYTLPESGDWGTSVSINQEGYKDRDRHPSNHMEDEVVEQTELPKQVYINSDGPVKQSYPGDTSANTLEAEHEDAYADLEDKSDPPIQCWPPELHRTLVESIFLCGLKHASPAVIMENMILIPHRSASNSADRSLSTDGGDDDEVAAPVVGDSQNQNSSTSNNNDPTEEDQDSQEQSQRDPEKESGRIQRRTSKNIDVRKQQQESEPPCQDSKRHVVPLTSERVKSHLQKYRNHKHKSLREFMAAYQSFMHKALTIGNAVAGNSAKTVTLPSSIVSSKLPAAASIKDQSSPLVAPQTLAEMLGLEKVLGADWAGFLSYCVMHDEQRHAAAANQRQKQAIMQPRTESSGQGWIRHHHDHHAQFYGQVPRVRDTYFTSYDGMAQPQDASQWGMNLSPWQMTSLLPGGGWDPFAGILSSNAGSGAAAGVVYIPFPNMTEQERQSPLGVSLIHVYHLFYSMTHHLIHQRMQGTPPTTQKNEAQQDENAGDEHLEVSDSYFQMQYPVSSVLHSAAYNDPAVQSSVWNEGPSTELTRTSRSANYSAQQEQHYSTMSSNKRPSPLRRRSHSPRNGSRQQTRAEPSDSWHQS